MSLAALPKTRYEVIGIASAVRACEHNDHFAKDSIPDEIRESVNNRTPNVFVYGGVDQWCLSEPVEDL